MTHRDLIIGIGNTLRGDDGIAAEIVRALEKEHIAADFHSVHQLTVEMAEQLSQYDAVLFIDASVTLPPGCWRCETLDCAPDNRESFSHELSPEALLTLASQLYGARVYAQVLSIGAAHFKLSEAVCPEIIKVTPMILDFVRVWPLTHLSLVQRAWQS